MTESEIERILIANVGKTIRVVLGDGVPALLSIVAVDQEGCTGSINHTDYDPGVEYWFQFDEIVDIPEP